MWQKITYSGTQCNNYLYFAFDAEYFDTTEITKYSASNAKYK